MFPNKKFKRNQFNPTILLKIPEGAYKSANEKGILDELLFYYDLKSLNPHGFFSRGSGSILIKDKLNISESTLRRNLKKLEKLTWIKRINANILLTNYDHLWITLGLDPHKEKIKIHKLAPDGNLIKNLFFEEIKLNLKRQKHKLFENYVKNELSDNGVNKHPEYMHKSKLAIIVRKLKPYIQKSLKDGHLKQLRYFKKHLQYKGTNFDVTLTCKGIACIFGYKAESQGYIIQQQLKNCNKITITKRCLLINKSFHGKGYVELPKSFFIKGKHLYKQLPNMITII
jgi:DNA-binding Lrp family transcriptional regulator